MLSQEQQTAQMTHCVQQQLLVPIVLVESQAEEVEVEEVVATAAVCLVGELVVGAEETLVDELLHVEHVYTQVLTLVMAGGHGN